MDRFFLNALVDEIGPRVAGRRVRMATADRREGILLLSFDRTLTLAWSFLAPEAAGPYLVTSPARVRARTASAGLKKSVTGALVAGLQAAELDRIVTLSLEHTRLSGRTSRSQLVLEVFATRVDLYLVDSIQQGIVEVFSSGPHSRLGPGELYQPPPPLPAAAPLAANWHELAQRLVEARRTGVKPRRSVLLAATGFTPLLVREMEWLVDVEKRSERDAFEQLRTRLDEKRPVLYAAKDPVGARSGRVLLASPVPLRCESDLIAHPLPEKTGFSVVMEEAVTLLLLVRRLRSTRGGLEAAVSKRLARARRLRRKLLDEQSAFGKPEELRRMGETLLAGLSRARRARDRKTVIVPDLFDPEEKEIALEVDPGLSLPANAQRLFRRAKKATRAASELSKRIAAVEEELAYLESFERDLSDALEAGEIDELEEEAREEGLLPPVSAEAVKSANKARPRAPATARLPPREFQSHRGHRILVGRSARSNEETTFRIAGPDDLWLHAKDAAGAHVVLRLAPGSAPDEREIEEAAALAAYFSKRRNDTAVDVLVTERRQVAKIKGAPKGLVKVQSSRTVRVAPRLLPERKPSRG